MTPPRRARESLRQRFLAFDDQLAAHGVPPLTAWWRKGIGRWLDRYERDHVLELWACVGRGAAKSTALYKLALFFALFGAFDVPPGEVHFAVVLSRLKEEAGKGVGIIDRWLTLLGIEHRLAGDVIELAHLPRGIRVVAASVAGASGWRAFFVGRDERSKWGFAGAENLDADEVDTSAVAMSATHALAPTVTTGSAWGMAGSFFETVTAGTDTGREVLGPTPTWVAAPHITEESTRRKERNAKRWAREYKCVFSALVGDVFEPEDIERVFAPRDLDGARWGEPVGIVDPASGGTSQKVDAYTFAIVRWVLLTDSETPVLLFSDLWGRTGKELRKTTIAETVARYCALAKAKGVRRIIGDQRDAALLQTEIPRNGLSYVSIPWTNERKSSAVERLQVHMREATIAVSAPHTTLRNELLAFQEHHAPSGALTYAARGGQHDDYVALLLTGLMAVEAKRLRSASAPRAGTFAGGFFPGIPAEGLHGF